jgi:cell division protein FtsB
MSAVPATVPVHEPRGTRGIAPDHGTAPVRGTRAATRAPLRVVPPANLPAPRAPFVVLVLVLLVSGLVSLLMLNTLVNENSFRLHALQEKQAALDLREQQLERDIDKREATPAVAAAARRLGLVPAGTPAFIRLPDGKVLGVPTPAKATKAGSGR